jgi:predicted nucleic acid-binding protein
VLLAQALFVQLAPEVIDSAAALAPPTLRSLDAIHIASALSIREELEGLITYDARMRDAAQQHGLRVFSPGA